MLFGLTLMPHLRALGVGHRRWHLRRMLSHLVCCFSSLGNPWACFKDEEKKEQSSDETLSKSMNDQQKTDFSNHMNHSDWLVTSLSGWLQPEYGSIVQDKAKTFCARPKLKAHSNSSHANVTLLSLLEFNQVKNSPFFGWKVCVILREMFRKEA